MEEEDPWVASVLGVRGLGEGLVLYPVSCHIGPVELPANRHSVMSRYLFKAKGLKHQVCSVARFPPFLNVFNSLSLSSCR